MRKALKITNISVKVKINNTTRIPEMLGRLLNLNKIKTKIIKKITWASILFTIEHRYHNMFQLRNCTIVCSKWVNFKSDACYSSPDSWDGGMFTVV